MKANTKSNTPVSGDADENLPEIDVWVSEVLKNDDPRDRVAVTGHRLSRGAFGRIAAPECGDYAANEQGSWGTEFEQ